MTLLLLSFFFAPINGALDTALMSVDAVFSSVQSAIEHSALSDSQAKTVSNVLKTKHDTVKNSINNIR